MRACAALVVVAMLLAGCVWPARLVDQRSFRSPGAGPSADEVAAVAQASLPPLPLLVIRFDTPDADYRPGLASAVNAAQARNPSVVFEVLAPVPVQTTPDIQAAAIRQGNADSIVIATALAAEGVPPARVHLGLHSDPGVPPREVLIYAR